MQDVSIVSQEVNGFPTENKEGERFSDHRRRYCADKEIKRFVQF